jgi:hypothetical protein
MKTLKQYITEGNELQQRINKHISKGVSVGAISPEGSHTDTPEKLKAAHKKIQSDLDNARKEGHIGGWSGPHKGQYQYGGTHEVAHESSYVVHAAGEGDEHHKKMVNALSKIGNEHKQESVLSVNKEKKGHWHYLSKSDKPGKAEYQGKLKYNKPLAQGTGRTQMKKGGHSFTTEK